MDVLVGFFFKENQVRISICVCIRGIVNKLNSLVKDYGLGNDFSVNNFQYSSCSYFKRKDFAFLVKIPYKKSNHFCSSLSLLNPHPSVQENWSVMEVWNRLLREVLSKGFHIQNSCLCKCERFLHRILLLRHNLPWCSLQDGLILASFHYPFGVTIIQLIKMSINILITLKLF